MIVPFQPPVHLEQVASITQGEGPIQITRENQARKVSILANIAQRDLGSIIKDIKKRLGVIEESLPVGYFIEYGGQDKEMRETFGIMSWAFVLATLLVYMILASLFESFLSTHPIPDPDLIIRTSGERRISNFLLYQSAYTELHYNNVLWPDFSDDDFLNAIIDFQGRDRRFGMTQEQIIKT